MKLRNVGLAQTFLMLATLAVPRVALAQSTEDGLKLSASQVIRHDSNLFRLPEGTDANLVLGRPSTAESIDTTTVGLRYAKDYSLQRIEIDLSVVDYKYRTYKTQNQIAYNYGLEWRWSVTPRLTGKVRADRNTLVNGFNDASAFSFRNESVRRYEVADAVYELDGVWRILAAIQRTNIAFAQPQVGEDGSSLRSGELGMRYQTPKGSAATLRWRKGRGQALNSNQGPISTINRDFVQAEQLLDLRWQMSGKTTVDASLGFVSREHERDASRDYSGGNASLSVVWLPTSKTRVALRTATDIGAYKTATSSFVRTLRTGLTYDWQISDRTNLQLGLTESRRRYGGQLSGVTLDILGDSTREASVTLRWSVSRNASIETSLQHSKRKTKQIDQPISSLQTSAGVTVSF